MTCSARRWPRFPSIARSRALWRTRSRRSSACWPPRAPRASCGRTPRRSTCGCCSPPLAPPVSSGRTPGGGCSRSGSTAWPRAASRPAGAAPQISAIRRSSSAARASTACSSGERSSAIACASQPSRCRRSGRAPARRRSVSSTSVRRPSVGSGRRATGRRPRGRRRVWAIDCGRTRSATARSLTLCAPSRSSRPSTAGLREREAVLGAQPADQLAEHDAQLAGQQGGVVSVRAGMRRTVTRRAQADCTVYLYIWRCVASSSGLDDVRPAAVGSGTRTTDRYKWIALSNTTLGGAAGDARRVDHADRDAGHLPRHPPRPAGPRPTASTCCG